MTDNTPLNADAELRRYIIQEIVHMVAIGIKTGGFNDWSVGNMIADKVLADRKKHELQARLEEYQQGLLVGASPEFIGKPMTEERIAELKQELENL